MNTKYCTHIEPEASVLSEVFCGVGYFTHVA